MNIIHLGKRSVPTLLAALALSAFTSAAQAQNPDIPVPGPYTQPNPAGSTIIAGWQSTDRVLIYNETASRYELNYTTAYDGNTTPFAANYTPVSGNYSLATTGFAPMGVLYPMGAASWNLNVTNYGGSTFSRLILQLESSFSTSPTGETADLQSTINPRLTLGSTTFASADVDSYSSDRYIVDMTDRTQMYSDFNFNGLQMTRITIEWDLEALGYTGSLENFSVALSQQAHVILGDVQLSVVAIPEPGSIGLIAAAGAGIALLRRRKLA